MDASDGVRKGAGDLSEKVFRLSGKVFQKCSECSHVTEKVLQDLREFEGCCDGIVDVQQELLELRKAVDQLPEEDRKGLREKIDEIDSVVCKCFGGDGGLGAALKTERFAVVSREGLAQAVFNPGSVLFGEY